MSAAEAAAARARASGDGKPVTPGTPVLEARGRPDGVTCFLAFDVLQIAGRDVMPEPWPITAAVRALGTCASATIGMSAWVT